MMSDREACQKRKQREDWYYIKIIECCNHFAHVRSFSSEGPSRSNAVAIKVTWITNKESGIVKQMESYKDNVFDAPKVEGDVHNNENPEKLEAENQLFSFLRTTASNSVRFENIDAFIEKNNILRTTLGRGSDVFQGKRLPSSHGKQFKIRTNNR